MNYYNQSPRERAIVSAIDKFLDELDRDTCSRKFIIPDTPHVHDAIRAMADAIERNV